MPVVKPGRRIDAQSRCRMTDQLAPPPAPSTTHTRSGPKQLVTAMGLDSVDALAQRIKISGRPVSSRVLYKWEKRGAPFTSETALLNWLGNHGLPIEKPPPTLDQSLEALRDSVAVSVLAQSAPKAPAEPVFSATNPDGTVLSPRQKHDIAATRDRERATQLKEMDIAERQKVLIHRDVIVDLVRELGHEIIAGLTDLEPRLLRASSDRIPADVRPIVREILRVEITHLRQLLAERFPTILQKAIGTTDETK